MNTKTDINEILNFPKSNACLMDEAWKKEKEEAKMKEMKYYFEKYKELETKTPTFEVPKSTGSLVEIYKPLTPEEQIKRLEDRNRELNETIIKLREEHEDYLLNEKRRPYKINIEGILKGTNVPEEKILEIVDYIIDRVEDDEESSNLDYFDWC